MGKTSAARGRSEGLQWPDLSTTQSTGLTRQARHALTVAAASGTPHRNGRTARVRRRPRRPLTWHARCRDGHYRGVGDAVHILRTPTPFPYGNRACGHGARVAAAAHTAPHGGGGPAPSSGRPRRRPSRRRPRARRRLREARSAMLVLEMSIPLCVGTWTGTVSPSQRWMPRSAWSRNPAGWPPPHQSRRRAAQPPGVPDTRTPPFWCAPLSGGKPDPRVHTAPHPAREGRHRHAPAAGCATTIYRSLLSPARPPSPPLHPSDVLTPPGPPPPAGTPRG